MYNIENSPAATYFSMFLEFIIFLNLATLAGLAYHDFNLVLQVAEVKLKLVAFSKFTFLLLDCIWEGVGTHLFWSK